jgi:transposase
MIARFVGMDIHKQYAVIVGVNRDQEVVLPSERVSMVGLSQWCAGHLSRLDSVVIEVTTNTWAVVELLERYAGRVAVANPYKTKLIAKAHIKNDKVDAHALACLLAANFISEVWIPTPQDRRWRQLARHRGRLRKQCTQAKNQLQHLLQSHNLENPERDLFSAAGRAWLRRQKLSEVEQLIVTQLLARIDLSEEQIQACEQRMARLAYADPCIARLMQITGIGLYTAFSIVAVLGDIHRFPSPSKLAGYVGLVPREHQSGRRAYHGHITKSGDRLLRWLLIEAAQAAVRWDAHWRQVHQRIAQRRGYSIAIVAVARKLLVTIWHMLTEETNYQYLRQASYVRKLQDWAYRIGRQALPASSSKSFVADRLCELGLPHLVDALVTTGRNARLSLAVPVT